MNRDILNALLVEYRLKRENAIKGAKKMRSDLIASDYELFKLCDAQTELFFAHGFAQLNGNAPELARLESEIDALENKIDALQKEKNIYPDAITPHFDCKVCGDTGYINGQMCSCLKQKYIEALIERSGMKDTGESFETFNEQIIPKTPIGKLNQRQLTIKIKDICKEYAEAFPNTQKRNILLIGKTGLGKSFLLNAIANEVLNNRYTVLKTTAYNMIDRLLASFKNQDQINDKEQFFTADLLIIDDLGSEPFIKNVTVEHLFSIINERTANNMHTLYSTNLGLKELQEHYGDRIFSRLIDQKSTYVFKLEGQDLRLQA